MSLRYGLIGSGMMGQEHICNVKLIKGVEITGIAEPDEQMRSRALALTGGNAVAYNDYRQMIADDQCDAYIIATPNDTHHAILLDLLALNRPILCEKPLCTNVADCRDILSRAGKRHAPLWVAMEYRYMPPLQRLLGECQAGRIGDPVMMHIREHRFPFLDKVENWNRFNKRTGGTLVEKCCHFWDLMCLLLNARPRRVFASAGVNVNHLDERYDGKVPDIFDNAFVTVEFADNVRAMLDLCMFAEGAKWQEIVSLTGALGRMDAYIPPTGRIDEDGRKLDAALIIADRKSQRETYETIEVDDTVLNAGTHHGSSYYQHVRFRDMILSSSAAEVSIEDGLWAVLVGEAAEKSARSGQAVELYF